MSLVVSGEMVDMSKSLIEQSGNVRIEQPVDHVAPSPIPDYETQIPKYPQLMRDGRLLHLHLDTEIADRARSGP